MPIDQNLIIVRYTVPVAEKDAVTGAITSALQSAGYSAETQGRELTPVRKDGNVQTLGIIARKNAQS